jgi:lipopolysaccharide/colanic/teichoic acid biosynthesis glycosyltransferase
MSALKRNASKFAAFLVSYGVLYFILLGAIEYIGSNVSAHSISNKLIILLAHSSFSILYCSLAWKDLFSYTYHSFVNRGVETIAKITLVSIVISAVFMSLALIISDQLFLSDIDSYLVMGAGVAIATDTIFYSIVFILQYLWVRHLIAIGFIGKNILIIGEPDERLPVLKMLNTAHVTRHLQGNVSQNDESWMFEDMQGKIERTNIEGIFDLFCSLKIGEVFIFIGKKMPEESIYAIAEFCRKMNIGYYLVSDIDKLSRKKFWARAFPYLPIIESFTTRTDSLLLISFKRIIDITMICFFSFLLFPIMLGTAIAIKLEDGGPVFHLGRRVGRNGKVIKFVKFRSMIVGAEAMQEDLMKYNERGGGPLFKMTNDPRLTRVGRIIRRFNIDELPQLLNVLKGDMSIVGPRPHLAREVREYSARDLIRLETIPGITCYPQLANDFSMGFREWMNLDLKYRNAWSLKADFAILAGLIYMIVFPHGKKK